MKTERHGFIVRTKSPLTIEVDSSVQAVYVRFKRTPVAKTIPQAAEHCQIAIDLDADGDVIGIEAVGVTHFSLHALLKMASVEAPNTDFSRAEYAPVDCVPA
jgi:uncharacterized protein YuzE